MLFMRAKALSVVVSLPERKAEVKVKSGSLSCDNFNVCETNEVKVMDCWWHGYSSKNNLEPYANRC